MVTRKKIILIIYQIEGESFISEYQDEFDHLISSNNWDISYKYNPSKKMDDFNNLRLFFRFLSN